MGPPHPQRRGYLFSVTPTPFGLVIGRGGEHPGSGRRAAQTAAALLPRRGLSRASWTRTCGRHGPRPPNPQSPPDSPTACEVQEGSGLTPPLRPLTAAHPGKLRPGVSRQHPPAAPARRVALEGAPMPHRLPGPQPPRPPDLGKTCRGPSSSMPWPAPAQWGRDAVARSLCQKRRWRQGSRGGPCGAARRG